MQHQSQHVIWLVAITVDDFLIPTWVCQTWAPKGFGLSAPFILIPVLEKKGNAVRPFAVPKGSGDNLLSAEEILQEPATGFELAPCGTHLQPTCTLHPQL